MVIFRGGGFVLCDALRALSMEKEWGGEYCWDHDMAAGFFVMDGVF